MQPEKSSNDTKKKKRIKKRSARHQWPPSPAECEMIPGGEFFIFGALARSCQPKREARRSQRSSGVLAVCHR